MRTIRAFLAAPFFAFGLLFMAIAGLILGETIDPRQYEDVKE